MTGCHFEPGVLLAADAPAIDTSVPAVWWHPAWARRRRLAVTTGSVRPERGYAGYTVRLLFDPATLTGVSASCDDLRVVTWDGAAWTELPRHVIGCATSAADLRFALPIDQGDAVTWRDAYLYYDNATAGAPPALVRDNVYRYWDDAATNRGADYTRGRMDPWLDVGHDNSLAWNAAGYYTYDTGDNSQSSYRIAVDERDVLVEAEWFHTGCYQVNMQSAVCARGIIAAGAGATETADHYYCTSRAQNPTCANTDQGLYDGDIVKTDNEIIALQGFIDPPPIVPDQWRKQALAVFGVAPTQMRFWDADSSWPGLATPPPIHSKPWDRTRATIKVVALRA